MAANQHSYSQPKRKLRRGLPMSDQYQWKPIPLDKRESAFSAQELIADLIRQNPSDIEAILSLPQGVDQSVWILDHLKRFLIQLGFLLVHLQIECDTSQCEHMMATENFAYRCSVHGPRMLKNCNAVSYSLHTLDDFVRKFNKPNYQSRTQIDKKFTREYTQCCRRCYRIFAHAFWHHKNLFDIFESEHYLCTRFIMFIRMYKLIPEKIFTKDKQIPPNSLYFDKESRKQHYDYILFQKEQRLKQENEQKDKELKQKQQQQQQQKESKKTVKIENDSKQTTGTNTNTNTNTSTNKKNNGNDNNNNNGSRVIKEDSDESSSDDENEVNIPNGNGNDNANGGGGGGGLTAVNPNDILDKDLSDDDLEKAMQEIYSDAPM